MPRRPNGTRRGRADHRRNSRASAEAAQYETEKITIKEGRVPEDWKAAKARQKDSDARLSIKYSKAKVREGADAYDGARLPEHIAKANTLRSKICAKVEHVFAGQKHRIGTRSAHDGYGPRHYQDQFGQPGLQSPALRLARGAKCACMMPKPASNVAGDKEITEEYAANSIPLSLRAPIRCHSAQNSSVLRGFQFEQKLDAIARLPRAKQKFVSKMLDNVLAQYASAGQEAEVAS